MKFIARKIGNSLYSDFLYVFFSHLVTMLSAFAVNKVASYFGGIDGYALFTLIKRGGGAIACIMSAGMLVGLPRYLSQICSKEPRPLSQQMFLVSALLLFFLHVGIVLLSFFFFPELIGKLLLQEVFYTPFLAIVFFVALGQAFSNLFFAYYQGVGDFKAYSFWHVVADVGFVLLSLLFYDNILNMILLPYCFLIVIASGGLLRVLNKSLFSRITFKRLSLFNRTLYSYGFPRMLEDLLLFSENIIPMLIILHKFGMTEMGLYASALSLNLIISPIFNFSNTLILQRFSKLLGIGAFPQIFRALYLVLALFLSVAILGSLFVWFFKESLVSLFLSNRFLDSLPLVNYFALAIIPKAIYTLYKGVLDAISPRPYSLIGVSVKTVVFSVLLYFFSGDIEDCAQAYLYVNILTALLSLYWWIDLSRKLKYSYNTRH